MLEAQANFGEKNDGEAFHFSLNFSDLYPHLHCTKNEVFH